MPLKNNAQFWKLWNWNCAKCANILDFEKRISSCKHRLRYSRERALDKFVFWVGLATIALEPFSVPAWNANFGVVVFVSERVEQKMRRRTHLCNRVLFGSNDAFSVELCSSFRMSRFGIASECLGRAERTAHIRARPILVQCRSSIEKMERNSNTAAALLVRMIVILKGEFQLK